jgi:hypothetical protein
MQTINMLSSATKVKGQGVSPVYIEQVNLVTKVLKDSYEVKINKFKTCDIIHFYKYSYETWSEKSWKCHELYSEDYVLGMWGEFYDHISSNGDKSKFRSTSNAK